MRTELVRIGNSRGVRIPKPLIDQCGLGKSVELRVENNRLVIVPQGRPRQHWNDAFRADGAPVQDELLLESFNTFDREEWKW